MLTQHEDFATDLGHNLALVFWPAVLQHVLYDVVTVLILQGAVAASAHNKESSKSVNGADVTSL